MRRFLFPFAALLTLGSLSCGGSKDNTTPTPTAPTPKVLTTIRVTLVDSVLVVGKTTQATAATLDQFGAAMSGKIVTWRSTDSTIASVQQTGIVLALKDGAVSIQATADTKQGSANLRALFVSTVTTVRVALADTVPLMGTKTTATVTVLDQVGTAITGKTVSWKSSNDSLATVASDGSVTAKMRGNVTLTASVDGKSGTGLLRVTPTPPFDCDIENIVDEYVVCQKQITIDGVPASRLLRYAAAIDIDKDGYGDLAYMPTIDEWYAAHPNRSESDWHYRNDVRFPISFLRGTNRKGAFTTFVPLVSGGLFDVNLPHEGEQIVSQDFNKDGINDILVGGASEYAIPVNIYPWIGEWQFIYLSTGVGTYTKVRIGESMFTVHGMTVGDEQRDGFSFVLNRPWSCFAPELDYDGRKACPTKFVGHVLTNNTIRLDTIRVRDSQLNSPSGCYGSNWYCSSSYVLAIDIDRRGRKDIVTFSADKSKNHHLWRKTTSGWQVLDSLISGDRPSDSVEFTVVGDFNGDGYDDIVAYYFFARRMRVWLNTTGGSFRDATQQMLGFDGNFPTTRYDPSAGIGGIGCDLNNDGRLDLFSERNHTIYLNTGGPTLRRLMLPFGTAGAFGSTKPCVNWGGTNGVVLVRQEFSDNTNHFAIVPTYPVYFVTLRPR